MNRRPTPVAIYNINWPEMRKFDVDTQTRPPIDSFLFLLFQDMDGFST